MAFDEDHVEHFGVRGMKWGIRRYNQGGFGKGSQILLEKNLRNRYRLDQMVIKKGMDFVNSKKHRRLREKEYRGLLQDKRIIEGKRTVKDYLEAYFRTTTWTSLVSSVPKDPRYVPAYKVKMARR